MTRVSAEELAYKSEEIDVILLALFGLRPGTIARVA
jgi:hypothetical protein